MPSQGDYSKDLSLLEDVKNWVKQKYDKKGNVYVGLVHRLDRPVAGIMVFAKTSKAAARLSKAFQERTVQKKYLAVVEKIPEQKSAELVHYIRRIGGKNQVECFSHELKYAKKAILNYEIVKTYENFALLSIKLKTGRKHQIRAQLSRIGSSIYGDKKYRAKNALLDRSIALIANYLEFEHPTTNEIMRFSINPPNSFPWDLFSPENPK